jgi:hypothetical protein
MIFTAKFLKLPPRVTDHKREHENISLTDDCTPAMQRKTLSGCIPEVVMAKDQ